MTDPPPTPSRADRRVELIVLIVVVVLLVFYYLGRADTIGVFSPERGWAPMTLRALPPAVHYVISAVLLGVLPVLAVLRITGLRAKDLGLGLGNWRRGLTVLALGLPLAVLAGKVAAGSPAMRTVYPLDPSLTRQGFAVYALIQFLYVGAWEVLFRGVLLFGLKDRLGDSAANVTQTALSVTAHFGRALNETFAALPAGLVFGWVDLRIGSIWYVAILHWIVGVSMEWFILS